MPVPDRIVFGPNGSGGESSYGEVRRMSAPARISALKRRLDSFLITQIDELGADEKAGKKVYSPFPLAVMTCVAIESLGQIMFGAKNRDGDNVQKDTFIAVAKALDPGLARQPRKDFKSAMEARWKDVRKEKFECIADVLYYFFRNTMVHGYRSKGVYLTEDQSETASWTEGDGFLFLNPYWFWEAFKEKYENLFSRVQKAQDNNPQRISCIEYLREMLG